MLHSTEIGELLGEYAPPLTPGLERAAQLAAVMAAARRQEAEIVARVNQRLSLPNETTTDK